ncbi:MAG: hypothetical protein AUH81_10415 [Candidatus Rokubacteria bacterium 13_1_40CM_4_69_5]|nr:MAG: hypothetical protein AUH81_10415 [Candidatus Rokubacteria bacterium 13_1_40CM_4_69_5]
MSRRLSVTWRIRAACVALIVPPLLRFASFGRVIAWLGSRVRARALPARDLDDAALARWVDGVLRRLPGPWHHSCLKRSVVLYHLLRGAGRPVELCIGVRREKGRGEALAAHAWLVRDGAPYLEPDPGVSLAHTMIARFPEPDTALSVACIPQSS